MRWVGWGMGIVERGWTGGGGGGVAQPWKCKCKCVAQRNPAAPSLQGADGGEELSPVTTQAHSLTHLAHSFIHA